MTSTPTSVEGIKAQIDFTKLVITLSTGAVAFTITFLDKFKDRAADAAVSAPCALYFCWGFFALAILMALLTLMALTGTLDAIDRKTNGSEMSEDQTKAATGGIEHVRWSAISMVIFFMLGVAAMIATGV